MRWVIPVLITAVAASGWGFGFFRMREAGDLEEKLALAREDQAELERLRAAAELCGDRGQAMANLEEVTKQLHARRTELASLNTSLADAAAELDELRGRSKEFEDLLAEAPERYVTTTGAKLRAGSGTGSAELAVVRPGVPLAVFAEPSDPAWYRVRLTGYMFHELLDPAP